MVLPKKVLLALLPFFLQANAQASGSGTTTRYWDCCKTSCAWSGKAALASGSSPVLTCDKNDNLLTDPSTKSGCDGGTAYMCSDQQPWAVSDTLSYGFAATTIGGGTEASWCCACYLLTFTSGPVSGKQMLVQATNTGSDLGSNQFDLSVTLSTSYLPVLDYTDQKNRYQVEVSESSTAAQQNGERPVAAGVNNTEAYLRDLNATAFPQSCNLDAIGALTGSKTPIIPQ